MSRTLPLTACCLLAALATGCVERRYVVLTDPSGAGLPPGAMVFENNKYVGPAPLTRPFRYYGNYRFTVVADGYETAVFDEHIRAPWYQFFPIDFITENLWPGTVRDVREFRWTLQPAQVQAPDQILERAQGLRQQGQGIGAPAPDPIPPANPQPQLQPPQ